jgi:hypothetical protein
MTDVGDMTSNRVNYRPYGVGRFLLTDMYVAGTILDMKSLPLTMFARNWVRPMNRARGLLIGAMVAVMCGCASLVAPAAVDADIPCQRWRFDGYTEFGLADGGKITFVSFDEWIDSDRSIETWAIPPNGGAASQTMIWGGVRNGNVIWMTRRTNLGENPLWLNGGVTDDGFAYGIAFDIHDHSSSWRSAAPLKCV